MESIDPRGSSQLIFELTYRGEVLAEVISHDDAVQVAMELRHTGIEVGIREPWLDGAHRIYQTAIHSQLRYWRTETMLYCVAYDTRSDLAYDYGAYAVPVAQRSMFERRTQDALSELGYGTPPSRLGTLIYVLRP